MFTTAFTQSFTQVQHQLQPIVVQPPAALAARPDPTKTKLCAPDPFDGTEMNKSGHSSYNVSLTLLTDLPPSQQIELTQGAGPNTITYSILKVL